VLPAAVRPVLAEQAESTVRAARRSVSDPAELEAVERLAAHAVALARPPAAESERARTR
jgi:hypothetical protein